MEWILAVTMQAQKEAPHDMQCRDKFLLQSVAAPEGATTKDITADMVGMDSSSLGLVFLLLFFHIKT